MNKNTPPAHSLLTKTNIAFLALLVMLIGFFCSRAALSISMLVFGAAGLWGVHPKQWLKNRWWLLAVLWVAAYGFCGLWSEDSSVWWERLQLKGPFLLMILAYSFINPFYAKQLRWITVFINIGAMAGVIYSLYFFFSAPEFYIENYGLSHVLPTIPKNDHIRFSLFVALAIAWNVFTFPHWPKPIQILLVAGSSIILAGYLHILAARSGLLVLYIFIAGWLVWLTINKRTRGVGVAILLSTVVALYAAYTLVPTLQRKVDYMVYTLKVYRTGGLQGNYSDMGRVISYDIATRLMAKHPVTGVGTGDLLPEMKRGYTNWYPDVVEENRLIPHNQYLIIALGCGIPALLIFIVWVIYPLFTIKRNRSGYFFVVIWLVLQVPLLTEPTLETQFGVFVYLFFLLLFYYEHRKEAASDKQPAPVA